jgi:hypothetical protein
MTPLCEHQQGVEYRQETRLVSNDQVRTSHLEEGHSADGAG